MRFISLDLLRFIAAASVAIPHLVIYFFPLENAVVLEIVTSLAVEIFFVLSGFVLSPFLARIFESTTDVGGNLCIFLVRRWMRTLPLYFLALLSFIILFSGKLDLTSLQYLLFLQNFYWSPPTFDYFMVSWSLAVEEWFYILFPAFVALIFKFCSTSRLILHRSSVFLWSTIVFILIITLLRLTADVPSENWGLNVRRVVLYRIDSIGFGILLYLLRAMIYKTPISVIVATIAATLIYVFAGYERIHANASHIIESRIIIFFATAVFSCAMLSLFLRMEDHIAGSVKTFSLWGGRISYGIYLLHIPVATAVGEGTDLSARITVLISIATIIVVTTGVYYYFEKPILDTRPDFKFDDKYGPSRR
jgi:peptidoglycan/LPS O-acetylase OafA/YrhL